MQRQLDIITRLVILEGHLDLPQGSLSGDPRKGLRVARRHFVENTIHASWLGTEDSGIYKSAHGGLMKIVGESRVDDIMQRALMGLGVDNHNRVVSPFRSVGASHHFGKALEAGKPPKSCVGCSGLSMYLRRRGLQETQRDMNRQETLQEEAVPEPSAADHLIYLLVRGESPLAQDFRGLLFASWKGTTAEKVMLGVWGAFVSGKGPTRKRIASSLGITPQGVYVHWVRGWALFAEALRRDTQMQRRLQDHLFSEGVTEPWEPAEVLSTIAHKETRAWMVRTQREG